MCCVWPHGPSAPDLPEGWESVHPHELGLASRLVGLAQASWGLDWGGGLCGALSPRMSRRQLSCAL